jgi:hypothetical protein
MQQTSQWLQSTMFSSVTIALGVATACTSAPEPRCVDNVVVDEFVEVYTQQELDALAGCEEIAALLVYPPRGLLDEPVRSLAPLSSLRVVRSQMQLRIPDVTSLAPLANLRAVGIVDEEGAGFFSLEDSAVGTLAGLELLGSEGVLVGVQLLNNRVLRSLEGFPPLERLGDLSMNGQAGLVDLRGLEGVASIGTLRANFGGLTSFAGLAENVVIDHVEVRGAAFAAVTGIPPEAVIGGLSIDASDVVVDVDLGGVDVGSVGLTDLPALTRVVLPASSSTPSSSFFSFTRLPRLSALDAVDAVDVVAGLRVIETGLTAVPFTALTSVTGDLVITSNAALPQADVEDAFVDVTVGGARKIAGNEGWEVPRTCPFADDGICDVPSVCAAGSDGDDCDDGGD